MADDVYPRKVSPSEKRPKTLGKLRKRAIIGTLTGKRRGERGYQVRLITDLWGTVERTRMGGLYLQEGLTSGKQSGR